MDFLILRKVTRRMIVAQFKKKKKHKTVLPESFSKPKEFWKDKMDSKSKKSKNLGPGIEKDIKSRINK